MHRLTHEQVYIDTNIFIAAIEAFNRIALEFFRRAEEGLIFALTSEIARGELIVKPIMAGNSALIQRYNHLLDGNHGVSTLAVDSEIVSEAARLSATTGLELVDALHCASAHVAGCAFILSEDRDMQTYADIDVLSLDDLEIA